MRRGNPPGQSERRPRAAGAGRAGLGEGQDAGGEAEGDQRAHLEAPAGAEAGGGAEASAAAAQADRRCRREAAALPGRPHQAGGRGVQLPVLSRAGGREEAEPRLGGPAAAAARRRSAPAPGQRPLCGALGPEQRTVFHVPQPAVLAAAFAPRGCEKPAAHQFAPVAQQPLLPSSVSRRPRRRTQGLLACRRPGVRCAGKNWPRALPESAVRSCSC